MKPRLKFHHGLWHCATGPNAVRGIGCTPLRAYDQWLYRVEQNMSAIVAHWLGGV